jgi:hypothetical protein
MVPILSLWLPIVVAAVLVFAVSSIVHMALTYHRSDYRQLPKEDEVRAALRAAGLAPGQYHFPYCASTKEMSSPAMLDKYREGPVGMLTVMPSGAPPMGKLLGLWFAFSLVVGVFVAYLAGRTLPAGTEYLQVFRVAGTTAFMAYGVAQLADSIWHGQSWGTTVKMIFDGLLYALVTAGAFGWLWPR